MVNERISSSSTIPSKQVEVYGSKMHYLEAGQGNPILFLHGVPTSSYVWRNVIPQLTSLGRCIAPDLIGFGQSDKPNIEYTIFDHIKYIDKFIETLGLRHLTIVMHGWGSLIGFNYAVQHEKNCKGLAFYEAFLRSTNGEDLSLPFKEQVLGLQDTDNSYDIVMNGAPFVDQILPQHIMRELSSEEMKYYREPFLQDGTAKPILQYIKELPNGDGTSAIDKLIADYTTKLMQSKLPKLMLYSVPGFITTIATIMWAKEHLSSLEIIEIGEELHLAQESCPKLMGETISIWLQGIESVKR